MNILIIGSGGREHALAWKAAQSSQANKVFVAPGNAGTALEPTIENVDIQATDIPALINFAKANAIELTIVGPEAPLAIGIVDAFQQAQLPCFGPTQAATQLESSKTFSKDFMKRHHIPTAKHASFDDLEKAKAYIREHNTPIVIKADGLAAGKGVVIAQNEAEAFTTLDNMLSDNQFGEAGHRVVIEEFLHGEEASFIVMVDGEHILPLATSQDHKARDDGDKGPNTGGMGAYSPAPVVTPECHERIMREVIQPTVEGMIAEGHPYTGFLYAGVMISPQGEPKVLEFNCRLGDPETQPIIMRLESDLVELCVAALNKNLDKVEAKWNPQHALGVVLAAGGYPNSYRKGDIIEGLATETSTTTKVFHAGTAMNHHNVTTNGGRILCVTALGNDIAEAKRKAYEAVKTIHWPDIYYRKDIGHKAIRK